MSEEETTSRSFTHLLKDLMSDLLKAASRSMFSGVVSLLPVRASIRANSNLVFIGPVRFPSLYMHHELQSL